MRDVPIPGGSAKFKDREELRGRDSKMVRAAVMSAGDVLGKLPDDARQKEGESPEEAARRLSKYLTENKVQFTTDEAMRLLTMKEAIVVAYLHSWSLEIPLPTLDTIGDLPDGLYQALDDAIGGELLNAATGVDFSVNPEKDSPTGPSSGSASSLRAEEADQTEQSNQNSSNGTDPIATEGSSLPSLQSSS